MAFCLPKFNADKFIEALKSGKIDPQKLIDMTSEERRAFLEPIVGADNVHEVNAQLESKLLLQDQKAGLVNWAKKITGITEATRTDILSKISRMTNVLDPVNERAFLQDLAAKKLGADVTYDEASTIVKKSQEVQAAKNSYDPKQAETDLKADPQNRNAGWKSEDARLSYGKKIVDFQKYIGELKSKDRVSNFSLKSTPIKAFTAFSGLVKSLNATLDNTFFGRQGLKTLFTDPGVWADNIAKSFGDIKDEVTKTKTDIDPIDAIKAEVFSRPNAMNGNYSRMGLAIGIDSEEAFPSSLPEKVPLLGRLYNASKTAFDGAALRMRADLADRIIPNVENAGIDLKTAEDPKGVGELVNSMTGRGSLGKFGVLDKEVNVALFSIKLLKSQFDTLLKPAQIVTDAARNATGIFPVERTPVEEFVKKQAAVNLAKIVTGMSAILFTANMLYPGSVEFDPRSSKFGKIKIGSHTIDISAGLGSIVTLAARITPTKHGDTGGLFTHGIGFWSKSAAGNFTDLTAGKYGQQSAWDVINDFWAGKLSPVASILHDMWTGSTYSYTKPTLGGEAANLVTPLPLQTFEQLQEPNNATALGLMIASELGFSVSTTPTKK